MMMYWGNATGGWGMVLMTLGGLLFWGLVIAGVVWLVRQSIRDGHPGTWPTTTPQQVLANRFARGEIDEEEYTQRLRVLRLPMDGRP